MTSQLRARRRSRWNTTLADRIELTRLECSRAIQVTTGAFFRLPPFTRLRMVSRSTCWVTFNRIRLARRNNGSTPGGPDGATVVRILRSDGTELATDVTHLRFDLFAVSDLQGFMRDPFDGVNAFTQQDDGLPAAFVSPLVRELDVLGEALLPDSADFDEDHDVDGEDFLAWQRGFGIIGSALIGDGDANHDKNVDGTDSSIWEVQFGELSSPVLAVPEGHLTRSSLTGRGGVTCLGHLQVSARWSSRTAIFRTRLSYPTARYSGFHRTHSTDRRSGDKSFMNSWTRMQHA